MISRKIWINSLVAVTILAVMYLFSGCASNPEPVSARAPETFPVPESSLEELTVPQFQEEEPARLAVGSTGKLYSLRVREAQIQDVLLALSQESGENLVVDSEVTGTVTVNLNLGTGTGRNPRPAGLQLSEGRAYNPNLQADTGDKDFPGKLH